MNKPVFLIPGFGGSLLYNIKKPYNYYLNHKILSNKWANVYPFTFKYINRWKKDMTVDFKYDENNNIIGYTDYNDDIIAYDMYGIDGIQNLVPEFNYLNDKYKNILEDEFHYQYYNVLNDKLIDIGYVPSKDLIGLPYDFRLILDPEIRNKYFKRIKKAIINRTDKCNKKAIIITHSIGGILLKWFLSEYVDEEFMNRYIDKVILINTPFGGTPVALKAALIGESYIPFLYSVFLDYTSKFSGVIMTFPNNLSYDYEESFMVLKDENINITLQNIYEQDNLPFKAWRDLYLPYLDLIKSPLDNIDTKIIISNENQTAKQFYTKNLSSTPYKIDYDLNGDGLITSTSLEYAKKIFTNNETLYVKNTDHTGVLSNDILINNIIKWVTD